MILQSVDGTAIYAEAVGDPSKPALVFIHGFSMSCIAFDAIFADQQWNSAAYLVRHPIPFLPITADLIKVRFDLRGHGRSGRPVDEESWESKRLAEDFAAVVDGFKLNKPFVLGW
jgi:pimeloyl-ACP methyl ester carboxylesterase